MRLESKVKLNVRGKVFGGEKNLACIPMIPATREDLIEETKMVAELKPDVIEWRVDYFEKAADARVCEGVPRGDCSLCGRDSRNLHFPSCL